MHRRLLIAVLLLAASDIGDDTGGLTGRRSAGEVGFLSCHDRDTSAHPHWSADREREASSPMAVHLLSTAETRERRSPGAEPT